MHPRHCCANNPPTGFLAESCPDKQVQAWQLEPVLGPQSMVFTPLALHSPFWTGLPLCGSSGNVRGSWRLPVPQRLHRLLGLAQMPLGSGAINEKNPGQRPLGISWRDWPTVSPGRLGWGKGGERTCVQAHLYLGLLRLSEPGCPLCLLSLCCPEGSVNLGVYKTSAECPAPSRFYNCE